MKVQVKDRLARVCVHVEDSAVALLRDTGLLCNLSRYSEHVAKEFRIVRGHFIQCRDVFARDDQNMNRRLGIDIVKSHDVVIFMRHLRGQFFPGDSAKKTRVHRPSWIDHRLYTGVRLLPPLFQPHEPHEMIVNRKLIGFPDVGALEKPCLKLRIGLPQSLERDAIEPDRARLLEANFK